MPNTGKCITVKVLQMLSCDMGPIFQFANLNRNLTQLRSSEIYYLRDSTARNGSLDM